MRIWLPGAPLDSRYGNVKVGNGAQQLDQIFGIERFFLIAGRLVTTQGNDAADTAVPIVFGNLTQLVRAGIDTGQVGGGVKAGFLFDAFDDTVCAVAFAGVCTVGYGNEFRMQGLQAMDWNPITWVSQFCSFSAGKIRMKR